VGLPASGDQPFDSGLFSLRFRIVRSTTAAAQARNRRVEFFTDDYKELLWSLLDSLEPEDGCLWIYDTNDRQTVAFTDRGMDCLRELIADHKLHPLPPRNPPPPRS